jgi:ABC-type dipeptide/oligopeptide/nickel transport system permease subunit
MDSAPVVAGIQTNPIAIMIAILGFNLLGDGLRDVLDPKLQ